MVTGDVSHVPRRGWAAARQLGRDVHDGDEGKLHPAEGLGLVKPEQAALVQELLILANEHAGVFGALGALAQDRHDLPRPPHRLAIIDAGEIAPHALRQRSNGSGLLARAHDLPLRACPVWSHVATRRKLSQRVGAARKTEGQPAPS